MSMSNCCLRETLFVYVYIHPVSISITISITPTISISIYVVILCIWVFVHRAGHPDYHLLGDHNCHVLLPAVQ